MMTQKRDNMKINGSRSTIFKGFLSPKFYISPNNIVFFIILSRHGFTRSHWAAPLGYKHDFQPTAAIPLTDALLF